jgi:hypothetical protein
MNRRKLISSVLAGIGAVLMPWKKRKPSHPGLAKFKPDHDRLLYDQWGGDVVYFDARHGQRMTEESYRAEYARRKWRRIVIHGPDGEVVDHEIREPT